MAMDGSSAQIKRILFVDDEPLVLEAIERAMFDIEDGERWDFVFESDPVRATRRLDEEAFDVVVSDMRMPGINGAQLLEHARRRQPRTLRIVLSGASDREAVMCSVGVTHQYLAKPCEPGALAALIARGRELDALLQQPDLQATARSLARLPARPRVYNELARLLADEHSTLHDVAALVESEPALAAQVLYLVNSAFFALPRSVGTIRDAVSFLGTQTIQSLVLCTEVFKPSRRRLRIDLDSEQARAMHVGALARDLGGDLAFTAGILHRVGHLVLAMATAESRARQAAQDADALPLPDPDPSAVGAYLLGSWGLAHELVEAVALQRRPPDVPSDPPVRAALCAAIAIYEACVGADEPLPLAPGLIAHFGQEAIDRARGRLRDQLGGPDA